MFGLFKRTPIVHEPIAAQRQDVLDNIDGMFRDILIPQILEGLDCDYLPNAIGDFGTFDNPIPVNGSIGEVKYLGKLRGETGKPVLFHRIGSRTSKLTNNPVDCYEVVCLDGAQWGYLYFDFYHPRRSNLAPKGYTLMPYDKKLGVDIPFAFGCNSLVDNFPYGLPLAFIDVYGERLGKSLAEKLNPILETICFQKNS